MNTSKTSSAMPLPLRSQPRRLKQILSGSIAALAVASGFLAPAPSQASDIFWNIDANATGWSTATNWLGGVVAGGTAGDTANFAFTLTAARTIGIDGDRTLGTLNVGGTAAFAYTLAGNNGGALIMDNGAGTAAINFLGTGAAQHVIHAPIVLNSNLEISGTMFNSVQFAGNISGAKSVTLDSNGAHPSGSTNAAGDFIFRGINTYTGGTTVTEARVQAYHSFALGTGAVTVNNIGQIYMLSGGNWANTFNLTGLGWSETTGSLGALRLDSNSVFTGTINIVGTGPAPTARINSHAASTSIFNGVIAGGASDAMEFTTSGAVTSNFVINNTNTNTGTTRIGRATAAAGTTNVQIGNNNTSGQLGSGAVTLDAGGVLVFNRTDSVIFANTIAAGTGGLTQNGLGTVTLTGASLGYTGTTTVNNLNGKLAIGNGGAVAFAGTGAVALSNLADIEVNTSSAVNLSGAFSSAKGSYLIQAGAGTTTLSGAADNAGGRALVNAGTLVLGKASTASIHSLGGGADLSLIVTGGTVQLGGTGGDQILNTGNVRITGGSLDLNGTSETIDSLSGTGGIVTNTNATGSTLTLGGGNSTSVFLNSDSARYIASYGGVIQDGTGTVALTTSGTGTQTLSGANTYTGATTLGGTGVLAVNGSTLVTGAVAIGGGSLAGTGSVGNVTLTTGGIRVGATGADNDAAGTLTLASLAVAGGDMRLNVGAASDQVAVTGTATYTAASTVTPLFTSAPGVAPVTLLTSTGLTVGAFTPTLAGLPATTRGVFAVAVNGNNLELQNSGAAAKALTWSGGTGAWDLNTTANFNAAADTFFNLDSVTFDDTSAGTVTLTAAATFSPTGISDTTTGANNITLAGTGIIGGAAGITKSGSSTLTINTPNTFTGAVNVTAGTLVAGNGAALGSAVGQTFISGGATLEINNQNLGAEVINIAGTGVGGNGALVNNGGGTGQQQATRFITLTGDATVGGAHRFDIRTNGGGELLDLGGYTLSKTGANSFNIVGVNVTSGNLVANQGTLAIETTSVVQGTGTITANAGATLAFYQTANGNITRPIVLNGGIVDNSGQNNTVNSPITTSGAVTFQGSGNTHNFTGSLTETSATSLTKLGASTYNVAGNVAYTGTTTVTQGTLQLGFLNAAAASAVNSVNIPGAATLGQAAANPGSLGAATLQLGTGGYTTITNAPATLTINNGTLGINTRSSNTIASNIVTNFFGGTNQINILAPEQDTTTTLTGAVGSSTKFGRLGITGGTVNLSATSGLNLNFVELNNQNGAGATGSGTSTATLNIQGGTHKVQAMYLGNAANSSGIVNMSAGTLTFEPNGNATLQNTNGSGFAMFGNDGLRIGHFGSGNSVPNQFNLSGGIVDASKTTVSVGWDGAAFLNITGGTLKARTLYIDNNGLEASPFVQRMAVSGGATIELGSGGMPTDGTNTSMDIGTSTWIAKQSSEWTRGMDLTPGGTMTLNTGTNRVGLSGQMVGTGTLSKSGNGILHISGTNVNTGAINATAGLLRMGNVQSLGDGTVTVSSGATLDINGVAASTAGIRPSSITIGGAGTAGSLGGFINSSGTTGGIGVDAGGTISIASDLTVYAVGRLEFGSAATNISGSTNTLTKNGQGQLIWRGTTVGSSIGNVIINGGHFYAEVEDNNIGSTGAIIANVGGAFSAWQGDGTTTQSKAIFLNGGAIMADRNSTWTGGLSVNADSLITRNATNTDAALLFDNATLDLGGFTLTKRDREPAANAVTFQNNTSSGDGNLDIVAGTVKLGVNSIFDGTGKIKVRTDGSLVFTDATASVTKAIELAGGSVTENLVNTRTLSGVNVPGYGYLGALNAGGTINPGAITLAPNAGMTFGSGNGYTANATAGTTIGAVAPSSITGGLATSNPNLTVSSNLSATTGNDTTFATWDGSKYTGVAPTQGTVAASGATDIAMVTAAGETVAADKTIASLIAEQTVTINAGMTLKLADGGLILRELATGGWTGAGNLTSGRTDGVLAITTTNHFDGLVGTVAAFTAGTVSDNTISAGPAAFRPVTVVKNGPGNIALAANSGYTGGTLVNAGRLALSNANALGQGQITIRDGGTVVATGAGAYSNNFAASGIGMGESAGVLGAMRVVTTLSGNIALGTATTRLHTQTGETGTLLGNITGANSLEKTGAGNLIVRSAVDYTGATILGNPAANLSNGTHTVFTLANGGTASSIGASSSAASNLALHTGTLNYIGGGASTDRLFSVIANTGNLTTAGITIASNGYGNLNFTNTGAIAMNNGAADVTLTLTANNYTTNTFSPTLSNPTDARLNVSVNGPGTWELNGASYSIAGTVALSGGADLILNTAADLTIPVLTGAANRSVLVKNGANTLTLGGAGLLAEADNAGGQLRVNAGTVIFDKRGANGFTAASAAGPGATGTRISAIGSSGVNSGDGLLITGGTVRYATTANADQLFDAVDVRINGGTLDFNGISDTFDSLNGTGGTITNGAVGTVSQVGIGNSTSLPSELNFRALASYGGVIEDGLGQVELIKLGNGVQVLSGANTFTGKTAILNGFVSIDSEARLGANPASLVLNQLTFANPNNTSGGGLETTANVTIDDANRGVWTQNGEAGMRPGAGTTLTFATPIAGPGGIQMVGQGGLTLSGANLYTGTTALYRGTLTLDYSTQNNSKLANGAALVLRGGNVVLSGGSHTEIVSGLTVEGNGQNAGTSYISRSSGTSVLNLNGLTRANGTIGGTLDIAGAGIATTDTNNTNGIITGAGASGFTGVAYATFAKNTWATSIAAGAADTGITGLGTYQANNFAAAANHVDVSGAATIGANSTVSTLRFNNAGASSIGGAFTLALNQQGILAAPGSGAATINVTTLTGYAAQTAAITTDVVVHQHSSNDLTINSIIANTVNGTFTNTTGLTKAGNGKLILTAANTYTGTTHVNEGTLELQGSAVLGNNVAANAVWVDGTLSLNRAGNYTIANNMGGGATGLYYKTNTGIATLSGGIGTYAGSATVSQGTLVTTGDAFGNANQINDLPANGTVSGTITLGDGSTGANNVAYYSGRGVAHTIRKDIVVADTGSAGTVVIGGGTGIATIGFAQTHQGNVQMNRSTILRGDTTDRLTFQGILSGNVGTLTIDAPLTASVLSTTNPGRVTLENNNTFVGNVVVNGAILQVGTGTISDPLDQIPDASNVTLNGVSAAKQAGLTLSGDSETINNLNGDVNTFIQAAGATNGTMSRLTVNGTGTFSGLFNGTANGGMTLEKAGAGTFTLAGTADNNSGRVLVSSGTLLLAKTSSGSVHAAAVEATITGGTMQLGGTGGDQVYDATVLTMYGGTFDLAGTNEGIGSLFGNAGTVTNSTGASTLTLGALNNLSSSFGGTIVNGAGTLALTKTGNGGAVLTGANTNSGVTTINAGYVQVGDGHASGSLGAGNIVTAANTQIVYDRSDAISIGNVISGAGGLVQNGPGSTELTASSSYTGPTVVNAGTLIVNGSISGSAVTLNPGTTLKGSGTVGAIGSNGGTIAPGNSPGLLTSGSVTANSATTFSIEVNTTTPATGYDQLAVNGTVDLGSATLSLSGTYLTTPGVTNDIFFVILNDGVDSVSGTFNGLAEGSHVFALNGQDYLLSYMADMGLTNAANFGTAQGNDVALMAVPEPSSFVSLIAGLGSLVGLQRFRRRRSA